MATLNINELFKKSDDPKIKTIINNLGGSLKDLENEMKSEKYIEGEFSRPWISEASWAFYSAYMTISAYINTLLIVLKLGQDITLISSEKMLNLLKTSLPEIKVSTLDYKMLPIYLEKLETKLINELQNQISGCEPDQENSERAKRIVEATREAKHGLKSDLSNTSSK